MHRSTGITLNAPHCLKIRYWDQLLKSTTRQPPRWPWGSTCRGAWSSSRRASMLLASGRIFRFVCMVPVYPVSSIQPGSVCWNVLPHSTDIRLLSLWGWDEGYRRTEHKYPFRWTPHVSAVHIVFCSCSMSICLILFIHSTGGLIIQSIHSMMNTRHQMSGLHFSFITLVGLLVLLLL